MIVKSIISAVCLLMMCYVSGMEVSNTADRGQAVASALVREVRRDAIPDPLVFSEEEIKVLKLSVDALDTYSHGEIRSAESDIANKLRAFDLAEQALSCTGLVKACCNGWIGIAQALIISGCDVNQATVGNESQGQPPMTPLAIACLYKHPTLVAHLLYAGASPTYSSRQGVYTPKTAARKKLGSLSQEKNRLSDYIVKFLNLWESVWARNDERAVSLLKNVLLEGTSLIDLFEGMQCNGYYTSFFSYVFSNQKRNIQKKECCELRINHEKTSFSDEDLYDTSSVMHRALSAFDSRQRKIGKTGLVFAASMGWDNIVYGLIRMGRDINERANDYKEQNTPLVAACMRRQLVVALLLLRHGADPLYTSGIKRCPLSAVTLQRSGFFFPDGKCIEKILMWFIHVKEQQKTEALQEFNRLVDNRFNSVRFEELMNAYPVVHETGICSVPVVEPQSLPVEPEAVTSYPSAAASATPMQVVRPCRVVKHDPYCMQIVEQKCFFYKSIFEAITFTDAEISAIESTCSFQWPRLSDRLYKTFFTHYEYHQLAGMLALLDCSTQSGLYWASCNGFANIVKFFIAQRKVAQEVLVFGCEAGKFEVVLVSILGGAVLTEDIFNTVPMISVEIRNFLTWVRQYSHYLHADVMSMFVKQLVQPKVMNLLQQWCSTTTNINFYIDDYVHDVS